MKLTSCILAGALALAFTASLHAAPPAGKTQPLTSPDQVPEGLAKSDWQSIRAAYEAGRHAFAPIATGWQARNPGQQWTTKFDGRGFVAEARQALHPHEVLAALWRHARPEIEAAKEAPRLISNHRSSRGEEFQIATDIAAGLTRVTLATETDLSEASLVEHWVCNPACPSCGG